MNIYKVTYRDGTDDSFVGNMRIIKCRLLMIENGWNDTMINIKNVKHVTKWKIPELVMNTKASFHHHLKENGVKMSLPEAINIFESLPEKEEK